MDKSGQLNQTLDYQITGGSIWLCASTDVKKAVQKVQQPCSLALDQQQRTVLLWCIYILSPRHQAKSSEQWM